MKEQQTKNVSEEELTSLLTNPSQIDPELLQRNMKLPLEMCEEGRELLKDKKYLDASKCFSKSIMSFEYLLKNNFLSKEQIKELFNQVMIPSYSNISLCHLKLGLYESVVPFCNQILTHDISNVKAKYRRGLAYSQMKKYDEAIEDFESVRRIDDEMKTECEAQIRECKQNKIKDKQRAKKIASAFVENIGDERSEIKTSEEPEGIKVGGKINPISKFQYFTDCIIGCCKRMVGK